MSVLDFPSVNPDVGTSLSLKTNSTTFTSELNNAVQTGKLVGDQWSANMPFTNRSEKEGRRIKAFLARLGGMTGRFRMTPPDLNQLGTMSGSGVVDGAGQTGSTLNTTGWDAEQPELFEAGDYIEFNGELKMVTDTVDTAGGEYIEYDGTNLMPSPFDPSGWTNNPAVTVITNTTEQNPSGQSFVGDVEQIGGGTDSINDYQGLSAVAGERIYISALVKNHVGANNGLRFRFGSSAGFLAAVNFDIVNQGVFAVQGSADFLITDLSSGYVLFQASYLVLMDDLNFDAQIRYTGNESIEQVPPIGNKIKCQAAYFGKTGKYQGAVSYPTGNLMPSPFDPSGWNGAIDPDLTYQSVTEQNPSGESFVGEFTQAGAGFGVISDSSGESVVIGDTVYISLLMKSGNLTPSVQVRIADSQGFLAAGRYSSVDGSHISGINFPNKATDLGGGYILLECQYAVTRDDASLEGQHWLIDSSGTGEPPIGAAIKCQAAYFGKGDDWPAIVDPADPNQWPSSYLTKASIPIAPPIRKATNDLDAIETQNPQAIFMLADDNQAAWDIQANYIHGASINCIEDVT